MSDISDENFSMKNHSLSQQYCDFKNGDVSIEYEFLNIYTIFQYEYSSTFNKIDDDFEKGDVDVSSGYGF